MDYLAILFSSIIFWSVGIVAIVLVLASTIVTLENYSFIKKCEDVTESTPTFNDIQDMIEEQIMEVKYKPNNIYNADSYKAIKEIIEKQQKLLELYKELHNKYRYPTWQNDEYVKEIEKQIRKLENE